jgi:hypothetical protein
MRRNISIGSYLLVAVYCFYAAGELSEVEGRVLAAMGGVVAIFVAARIFLSKK